MPLLQIITNRTVAPEQRLPLLKKASSRVAELLGKPESYVMVVLKPGQEMSLGGSVAPLAYLELKSIGLPRERTAELSAELCRLVAQEFDIPQQRIYIEFSNVERELWGWNGATFAR